MPSNIQKTHVTSNNRFLIVSQELGVYIGSCMGMGFWSRLDAVGQASAVSFESEEDGLQYASTWESPVEDLQFIPVIADSENFASEEACIEAGVSPWSLGTVQ